MKKILLLSFVLLCCFFVMLLWQFIKPEAKLAESKIAEKQVDDFILHMRVNETEKGIQVLQSIQYVGKEIVEIKHQSPLVSVSLLNRNHDYTGSTVSKALKKGDVYPGEEIIFPSPKKGECNLYLQARFNVNGEEVSIDHVEKLFFE
ncbi:hypothetical protein CIL05_14330 [Virgibacillus profundi]|uniref:DUF4352 domain-containing protein n=1 Tax=Virgibacillus profundi TaxID=2024555 RepID=A0A2A2I9X1_9BACI|nr:hypothetical protein [Virgibacillus profundi]PAV28801.1 hypothetical protein CIL05_14330 [Virgibacillus profundi]PXY52969.1 hypothetical protein CIT14_14455 [Virgibacillus profundi]